MAVSEILEVERKYDVGESDELPSLASLPGVERVGPPEDEALDAVYFDTAGLALASRRITLRRRTGGQDAGWHLKLPVAAGKRREIREALGSDPASVPQRLKQLVRAHTRDQDLVPVARLKTRRTVLRLFAADGTALAEFSDDRVDSQTIVEPRGQTTWREWELELIDGPKRLLKAADTLLAATGHLPAALPSKLARGLGALYPPDRLSVPSPRRNGPASALLVSYMSHQIEALKTQDAGVREAAPDAVHQLRVAARRMRSALATFRKLTDPGTAGLLRAELQWLAGAVGAARDTEVMRTRLLDLISAEPPELLLGPVARQIEEHFGAASHAAHEAGLAALDSQRYFRLLDSLDGFLADPPLSEISRKKAHGTVGRLVTREGKRLRKAVRVLDMDSTTTPGDTALHDVRKSAKRLRYAAEAARPVLGKRAIAVARAAEDIQEVLGEHQDSAVTRELLRELAAQAQAAGGNAFSYGRLHALEQSRGEEARARFFRTWRNSPLEPLDSK